MDIQRKAFESSNNVNPDWSFKFDEELQQYVATDFEMTNQVDEFNEHWDTFRAGWEAKAQAVPEGFVVVNQKDLLELTIAINAVDLATHTESKTNEVREMWQQVALKLMALGTAQEPTND
jgi:hypothetical protein